MTIDPRLTTWNRVEPRPSTNDFVTSLRCEIRDPLWMLTRQRQMGEFAAEDAGSPAFTQLAVTSATAVSKWLYTPDGAKSPTEVSFDPNGGPMEAQLLAEPFSPDVATRAELGQTFLDLIDVTVTDKDKASQIRTAFEQAAIEKGIYRIQTPTPKAFDPLDQATEQFLGIVGERVPDGFRILTDRTVPPDVAKLSAEVITVFDALATWVKDVFGVGFGDPDPAAWDPARLTYQLSVKVGDNSPATLAARPDTDGSFSWSSFDVTQAGDPLAGGPTGTKAQLPVHVRFPGMPAPRFWDFEDGSLPLPDVQAQNTELAKLMLVDVALLHGIDWFVVPYMQPVGKLARIQSLVVQDVFGHRTLVERAEKGNTAPGNARWTMFSLAQPGVSIADFSISPPAAARFRQIGPTLEEARFAQDQMANMVWAIEGTTESALGEPRSGSARDAAVVATVSTPPPSATATTPLRYQIESPVPVYWIPFLPVPSLKLAKPALDLEKATVPRRKDGLFAGVPAVGKVLRPPVSQQPYRIPDQEIPRAGLTIQRVVYRSRWTDGRAYLWVARRRVTGTGETQSGLRFDAALATGSAA